jgi:D-alanyl-D-alanine carboxypeptidase
MAASAQVSRRNMRHSRHRPLSSISTPALSYMPKRLEIPWYPASTAKLMTALITFQALKRGDVDLSTPVILSHNAMDQSAAYAGLKVGNAMTLEDALYAVLVGSANEVAVALAETVAGTEAAFVDLMNAQADRLGLTATHFTNPNGLFDQKQTVSARDLAVLGRDLFQVYPDYRRDVPYSCRHHR